MGIGRSPGKPLPTAKEVVGIFTTTSRCEHNRPLVTLRWTDRDDETAPVLAAD